MMLDINLLPKKTNKVSGQIVSMLIVFGTIFAVVAGFFGVFVPLQKKIELNNKIALVKEEIEKYNVSEADYYELLSLVDNKRVEGEALLYLKNNRLDITDNLDNIEASMPEDIYLMTLKLAGTSLDIEGYSKDYTNIAKFIIKLRTIDDLFNTTFTTATLEKSNSEDTHYFFTIHNNLIHRDIIEELQTGEIKVQQAPVEKTSEGGDA